MKKSLWLALIVGLQLVWMVGTAAIKEAELASAQTVLLETRPVDPRDLLRGDYIILDYKISNLPHTLIQWSAGETIKTNQYELHGRKIYVLLQKRGDFHEAVSASFNLPKPGPDQVLIAGTVLPNRWSWQDSTATNSVHVNYGMERYYVKEGTGNPRGKITVKAAVPGNHKPVIKEVFVDGKPYAQAMAQQR